MVAGALANIEQISDAEAEAAQLDPHRPDALASWNAMRPKPQPQPRQRKLDTQAARADHQHRWDQWVDGKILAQLDIYSDALAQFLAEREQKHNRQLAASKH